jgi:hypothetical protein
LAKASHGKFYSPPYDRLSRRLSSWLLKRLLSRLSSRLSSGLSAIVYSTGIAEKTGIDLSPAASHIWFHRPTRTSL